MAIACALPLTKEQSAPLSPYGVLAVLAQLWCACMCMRHLHIEHSMFSDSLSPVTNQSVHLITDSVHSGPMY